MADKLHKNYKKASNLIIAALVLEPVEFFFSKSWKMTNDEIGLEILGFSFIALTAYAARRGVAWVKYILSVLITLTIVSIASSFISVNAAAVPTASLLTTVLQVIVMTWALVLIFQVPTSTGQNPLDSDI